MQFKSLGYQTDLMFVAFDGELLAREDYVVVRSPRNPTFYWGNFLLYRRPPGQGDLNVWLEAFGRELGMPPQVKHCCFGLDDPAGDTGELAPFLEAGFVVRESVVLTASQTALAHPLPVGLEVRRLSTADEWRQAAENEVLCREPGHTEEAYRTFVLAKQDRYRAMEAAGMGGWFGAFLEGRLVADLGLFCQDGLARYQSVQTHPEVRRRGIAGALVHGAAAYARAHWQVERWVIVAEAGGPAARLYGSLGFVEAEKQVGLERW